MFDVYIDCVIAYRGTSYIESDLSEFIIFEIPMVDDFEKSPYIFQQSHQNPFFSPKVFLENICSFPKELKVSYCLGGGGIFVKLYYVHPGKMLYYIVK